MTSKHDDFRLDNGERPVSECPVCRGSGLDEDGKAEPCGECDGFGEIIKGK